MLPVNTPAPDFELLNQDGVPVRLKDFRGRKVVLYFYPKDNTPGCTRQACAFAREYPAFEEAGAAVIGVSRDSVRSHRGFADKHALHFILLSDPDLSVHLAYDVRKEKKLYGKLSIGTVRTTYLIDEAGMITRAYANVKPDTNAGQMLKEIAAQQPPIC
ncbi:MAG: peroxiredoxin [Christensenellaceae bacterium]|nr:peroxiredoxin [Christensenellaceae bacterium]MEA5066720.1 peroxiredoxin [Eubacteriales bacterium]MEA5068318.1 peroxiredoxin [Christensenellaceae bacterium]